MRLDKFIAENTGLTRSQATKAIRQSAVKINGEIVKMVRLKLAKKMKFILKMNGCLGWKKVNILCCISLKATFALMMTVTTLLFINSLNRHFLVSYTVLVD